MAGVKVHYEVVKERVLEMLRGVDLRTRDLTPVMQDFAGYLRRYTWDSFAMGGRPRWAPLKPITTRDWLFSKKGHWTKAGNLSQGGRAALAGRKILIGNAILLGSIRFAGFARSVEGYAGPLKYAAIHQFGGVINIPAFGPRQKKALAWPGGAHPVLRVRAHTVTIPARPYLAIPDECVYGYLFPRIISYVEGEK